MGKKIETIGGGWIFCGRTLDIPVLNGYNMPHLLGGQIIRWK